MARALNPTGLLVGGVNGPVLADARMGGREETCRREDCVDDENVSLEDAATGVEVRGPLLSAC